MSLDLVAARAWLEEHLAEPVEIADDDALDRAAAMVLAQVAEADRLDEGRSA